MSDGVRLSVKSDLNKIIEELQKIRDEAKETNESFSKISKDSSKAVEGSVKRTEGYFDKLKSFGRRTAAQIGSDFKTLFNVGQLAGGLSIANQFKNSVQETVKLSDTIRKLSSVFGIASKDFASFQGKMTKGLGDIGLSSEVAVSALEGLSQTQVRGESNLIEYSKAAGMLGSITGQQGQEGAIAKGMADLIKARGGDVNDAKTMQAVAEDIRRIFVATGAKSTDSLSAMERLFAAMSSDLRKTVTTRGLSQMAAAASAAGPNATAFLEEYLKADTLQRQRLDAMGMKGVVKDTGEIDIDKFKAFAEKTNQMFGSDPRVAAKMLGMTDEAAEGFVRLTQNLDRVKQAQERVSKATGSLNEQYRQSMGLGEAFRSNINRVKGLFGELGGAVSQGATDLLSKAGASDVGSAAVVGGGALAAAVLTGGGLRGLMGTAKGLGKASAIEAVTGEKVQNVYVTNAAEIGSGLGGVLSGAGAAGGAGKLAKVGKFAGAAAGVGVAAYAGMEIGKAIEPATTKWLNENTTKTNEKGFEGNLIERGLFRLDRAVGGRISGVSPEQWDRQQKIIVELNKRELKATKQPTRGASF